MGDRRLVGREDELRQIALAIGEPRRHVLITGEVGIGKTRLLAQAAQAARDSGAVVVEAACLPLDVRLPLLPVIEMLRNLDKALGSKAFSGLPGYTVEELARLVPEVIGRQASQDELPPGEWKRQRMFGAIATVLAKVAEGGQVALFVEDLHWCDAATLDLLTYLRASSAGGLTMVVTCRSDEAPLDAAVARWIEQARRPETARLELAGLSRPAIAELAAQALHDTPPPALVEELHRRTEGNPYFAEELLADGRQQMTLSRRPPRALAELLLARSRRVGATARSVLAVLSVAGRPLPETLVAQVTGMPPAQVTAAMHELVDARLALPDSDRPERGCRARHALLAEAVAADLLADERRDAHAGIAEALQAWGDPALSAEIAGHWSAAGRPYQELVSLLDAAEHSHRLHAYSQAADLWQRATGIAERLPDAAEKAGVQPGRLRIRIIDALQACGRDLDAAVLTDETYERYRDTTESPLRAALLHRTAWYRGIISQHERPPSTAYALFEEASRLHDAMEESVEQARMLSDHARFLWMDSQERSAEPIFRRALQVAERCGDALEATHALLGLAEVALLHGDPAEGLELLDRVSDRIRSEPHSELRFRVDFLTIENRSNALLKMGHLEHAGQVALDGLERARRAGAAAGHAGAVLHHNAAESFLERGLIDAAAALISEICDQQPRFDDWNLHLLQAQVEICRGEVASAVARTRAVEALGLIGPRLWVYERLRYLPRAALWAGDPATALNQVETALPLLAGCAIEHYCGEILALGARAVADLAEAARARRDDQGQQASAAAADRLAAVLQAMRGRPFTDHPFLATIPGDRADWQAEIRRAQGIDDPDGWAEAAAIWQGLGRPHRSAYAWWRHAQALLARSRNPAAAAEPLRAAAEAAQTAETMAPLSEAIGRLAARARIPLVLKERPLALKEGSLALKGGPFALKEMPEPQARDPYGLTQRERHVLRLIAKGHTNAEIGAELFMSPKTASVHVSNILRKLDVANRAEAAAVAERAGLTD